MRPIWYDVDGQIVQSIFDPSSEYVEVYVRADDGFDDLTFRGYKEKYEDPGPHFEHVV